MYEDMILWHTTWLRTAETIVEKQSDMILDIFVEGDLTKIGLLLADLAPSPRTGETLPMEMTRSLLCYSGTFCSFPNIIWCLKRFISMTQKIHKHDSEDRLTSIIAGHHQYNRRPPPVHTGAPQSDRPSPAPPAGHLHARPYLQSLEGNPTWMAQRLWGLWGGSTYRISMGGSGQPR